MPPDSATDFEQSGGAPAESALLQQAYKRAYMTHAELAIGTGLSVGSVRIALSGVRYRDGEPRAVRPPDSTLAKLASLLGVTAGELRSLGRDGAASLMDEVETTPVDIETPAAIAGRQALAKQVLSAFSTEELRAEVDRRLAHSEDEEI